MKLNQVKETCFFSYHLNINVIFWKNRKMNFRVIKNTIATKFLLRQLKKSNVQEKGFS